MINLTEDIAELIGAHVGDGSLYQTNWSLVWELRGSLEEKEYYLGNITPLIKRVFGIELNSKFRSDGGNGVWGVQTSNKEIINLFLEFGFQPGSKTHTVSTPHYVFKSDEKIKRAFVRGLFDSDGCLHFDKPKNKEFHTYPKLKFSFASLALRDSLKILLDDLGFRSYIWKDRKYYSLCIAGKEMLEKWVLEISPRNPKHLNKYHIWKQKGFYPMPRWHNLVLR